MAKRTKRNWTKLDPFESLSQALQPWAFVLSAFLTLVSGCLLHRLFVSSRSPNITISLALARFSKASIVGHGIPGSLQLDFPPYQTINTGLPLLRLPLLIRSTSFEDPVDIYLVSSCLTHLGENALSTIDTFRCKHRRQSRHRSAVPRTGEACRRMASSSQDAIPVSWLDHTGVALDIVFSPPSTSIRRLHRPSERDCRLCAVVRHVMSLDLHRRQLPLGRLRLETVV